LGTGWWAAALGTWLDLLFPPRCAGCDRTGAHFCDRCVAGLAPIGAPSCVACGQSLPGTSAHVRCADCRRAPLPLVAVRSAALYEEPLRTAIHRFKYRGRRAAGGRLSELLVAPAETLGSTWPAALAHDSTPLVVPVPLHARRERERGYNQAALLASPLAGALRWRFEPHALWRVKDTEPLVRLSARQRREAVRGAFAARRRLDGEHILLVDDVATTCSTLASAAGACLAAGAASVAAVTLARDRRRA
jgi:ComF family protein